MDEEFGDLDYNKVKIGVIGVFLLGLFIFALGLGLTFFKNKSAPSDIQIISSAEQNSASQEVVVHVDGAVVSPGVYHLAATSRASDAINAAGGLLPDADSAKVNLAAKIGDGQKLRIPWVGESIASTTGSVSGESTSLININTASESELDKLPQVGPVTANKIIASRPYSSLEDLLSKKVVSSSVWEKIKDLISI